MSTWTNWRKIFLNFCMLISNTAQNNILRILAMPRWVSLVYTCLWNWKQFKMFWSFSTVYCKQPPFQSVWSVYGTGSWGERNCSIEKKRCSFRWWSRLNPTLCIGDHFRRLIRPSKCVWHLTLNFRSLLPWCPVKMAIYYHNSRHISKYL